MSNGPSWEDAEALALAAGWDRVETQRRGALVYVRLWKGDAAWETYIAGKTPAHAIVHMLQTDADRGGKLKRYYTGE